MQTLDLIQRCLAAAFALCYAYQAVYLLVALVRRPAPVPAAAPRHYAVLICARNEAAVLPDLLRSIRRQTYPQSYITTFVMADNCTDDTAALARAGGAVVYTRSDPYRVGKGFALQALLQRVHGDWGEFDGYFVFDADNILTRDYIRHMNDTFAQGYAAVTGYRNSKNYAANWLSAGYALWFLRESSHLNGARHLCGVSAAVSGTGFVFGRAVARRLVDWPFHMLTEDIQFTAWLITNGLRVGYCPRAVLYDEQPVRFAQSWRQRMRWARGYLQVLGGYGMALARGALGGSFACFDMLMTLLPAFVLSIAALGCTAVQAVWAVCAGGGLWAAAGVLVRSLGPMYLGAFALGVVTTCSQWRSIQARPWQKLAYTVTFPLFLATYVPISLWALVRRPTWQPIAHTVTARSAGPLPGTADGEAS